MTIECPYCHYEMDNPEECYEEDKTYEHGCGSCGKQFVFTLSYSVDYHPRRADCLNGAEHDYVKTSTYPPRYAVTYCAMCGTERPLTTGDE